jgi:lysophospholipase L1-like esterase
VGIGSVEYFDENKNNTLPMFRVERLSHDDRTLNTALLDRNIDISPVFPRVFAQTLANRLEQRIRWRSAGVDGGDVSDMINFCSGVIEEESKFGHPPDVVVVICGINDLKKTVSNPFKSKSARGFRSSMEDMINEIRKHAPNASIIPSFTSTDVSQK